jgi:hypothetical protein
VTVTSASVPADVVTADVNVEIKDDMLVTLFNPAAENPMTSAMTCFTVVVVVVDMPAAVVVVVVVTHLHPDSATQVCSFIPALHSAEEKASVAPHWL